MGSRARQDIGGTRPRAAAWVAAAAWAGAFWGAAGYAVLWGHTWVTVSRQFVLGPVGTALLLPARVVLWSIRAAEAVAGRPFHFPDSNWWIGVAAALVGAGIAAAGAGVALLILRAVRRRGASAARRVADPAG